MPDFSPLNEAMAGQSERPLTDEAPGALMLYTSGTTGAPKGVWRPLPPPDRRATPSFAADLIPLFGFDEGTRYLSTAPLYHAAPLRASLSVTAAGGSVIGMRQFDAAEALRSLATQRITHSQWVPRDVPALAGSCPALCAAFRARRCTAWRCMQAAPCPPPLKRAMIEWWGEILVEYYSAPKAWA